MLTPIDLSAMAQCSCRFRDLARATFASDYEFHAFPLDVPQLMATARHNCTHHIRSVLDQFGSLMTRINVTLLPFTILTDAFAEHLNRTTLRLLAKHCRHPLQRLQITNLDLMPTAGPSLDLQPLLTHLTHLELSTCNLDDLYTFAACQSLLSLTVNASPIDIVAYCAFPKLQELHLQSPTTHCTESPALMRQLINEFLLNHDNLQRITISGMALSMVSASITYMSKLVELRVLNAPGSLLPFARLDGLQCITLHRSESTADRAVTFFQRSRSHATLRQLDLRSEGLFTIVPAKRLHHLANLTELKFIAGTGIDNKDLAALWVLKKLTVLVVRQAVHITWVGLMPLVDRLINLRRIGLVDSVVGNEGLRITDAVYTVVCAIYAQRASLLCVTNFEESVDIAGGQHRRIRFVNDVTNRHLVQVYEAKGANDTNIADQHDEGIL